MYRNMSIRSFFILCTVIISAVNLNAQSGGINYPVTLNNPYHLDTIDNRRPTFSWQCDLATINLDPRLDMQFVLVEKNKNQPIGEALLINTPLLFAYSLTSSSLSYPNSNEELIPGHTYAWQVSVMMNGMPIMQSQQWEFTIRIPKPVEDQFFRMTTTLNNTVYNSQKDYIRFVVKDNGKDLKECTIRKTDNSKKSWKVSDIQKKNKNLDNGYYHVPLENLKLETGMYLLEVFVDNVKYSLQFYYKK